MGQSGIALIAAERERQEASEGWTPEHDDNHDGGELVNAAVVYASPRTLYVKADGWRSETVTFMTVWPHGWEYKGGKRVNGQGLSRGADQISDEEHRAERMRELAKAGALIAAEIDRLQRKSS